MTATEPATGDPTRDAISAAAEAVRAANHAAALPEYPGDLSARVGALVDVLRKLDQLAGRLAMEASGLDMACGPLRHDADGDPDDALGRARDQLYEVQRRIGQARDRADDAHGELAHLALAD